jgi:hypothetical protein
MSDWPSSPKAVAKQQCQVWKSLPTKGGLEDIQTVKEPDITVEEQITHIAILGWKWNMSCQPHQINTTDSATC